MDKEHKQTLAGLYAQIELDRTLDGRMRESAVVSLQSQDRKFYAAVRVDLRSEFSAAVFYQGPWWFLQTEVSASIVRALERAFPELSRSGREWHHDPRWEEELPDEAARTMDADSDRIDEYADLDIRSENVNTWRIEVGSPSEVPLTAGRTKAQAEGQDWSCSVQ